MPAEQVIPRIPQNYALYAFWPSVVSAIGAGSAFETFMSSSGGAINVWNLPTGTAVQTMELYRQIPSGRIACTVANNNGQRMSSGMHFRVPLEIATALLVGPCRMPDPYRVCRWTFFHAIDTDGGAPNVSQTGFGLTAGGSATPSMPTAAGVGAGLGIQGRAAGGWRFFSKPTVAGGFVDTEDIALPGGLAFGDWALWDFELSAATPTAAAQLRIAINGTVVITRAWTPGHNLPTPATFGTMYSFRPSFWAQNQGTFLNVHIGPHAMYYGRYRMDGVELFSPFGVGI